MTSGKTCTEDVSKPGGPMLEKSRRECEVSTEATAEEVLR